MNNNIPKNQAADSAQIAWMALEEVMTLRDVAQTIRDVHEECQCETSEHQVEVLANCAEEKLELVMEHLTLVSSYFQQEQESGPRLVADAPSAELKSFQATRDLSKN